MKPPKNSPVVILPPPQLALSKMSNKYDLILDIKWGDFEQEIKVSRELGSFTWNLVEAINKALLEGSESKPYLLK